MNALVINNVSWTGVCSQICQNVCPLDGLAWEPDERSTSAHSWNVSRVGEQ